MSEQHNILLSKDCKGILLKVYENRYFSNHGPLAQQFESELEALINVRNAVSVTNNALAILIAISGSDNGKKVAILSGCEKDVLDAANMSNVDFLSTTIESLAIGSLAGIGMVVVSSNKLTNDYFSFFKSLIEKGIIVIICYSSISNFNEYDDFEGAISVYSRYRLTCL